MARTQRGGLFLLLAYLVNTRVITSLSVIRPPLMFSLRFVRADVNKSYMDSQNSSGNGGLPRCRFGLGFTELTKSLSRRLAANLANEFFGGLPRFRFT
jgi:hypothetical protein